MYIMDNFIDVAIANNEDEWKSPMHRTVACDISICNPNITRMDQLMVNCKIINAIDSKDIQTVTLQDVIELGVYI